MKRLRYRKQTNIKDERVNKINPYRRQDPHSIYDIDRDLPTPSDWSKIIDPDAEHERRRREIIMQI